ncbi:MAG: M48 family metallopeptidase [Paludibacteraceae bacterium]|nr:M48 family metallopeptidase [Paludibacteraceae bacterium]MBP6284180.1 M48 family metallopeptidase [Paludibacteraceae bacterium]
MTQTYIHEDLGTIFINHSTKSQNIRIAIGKKGIQLTVPYSISIKKGLDFLETKKNWVEHSLKKLQERIPPQTSSLLELETQTFSIKTREMEKKNLLFQLKDGILWIEHHASIDLTQNKYQSLIRDGVEKFVIAEAKRHFSPRLQHLATQHDFAYTGLRIQRSKTRWGSCSSKRNINLSAYLLFVPQHLSDYVLIHELCHTKEMNHSSKFWKLVAEINPHYIAHRKEMKKYSHIMHLFNEE